MKKLTLLLLAIVPWWLSATPVTQVNDSTMMDDDEPMSLDELDAEENEIADDSIVFRLIGDTLVVSCPVDRLPRRLKILCSDGSFLYKQLPFDTTSTPAFVPADSLYRFIWTDARVNPYGVPIDSLTDSMHISMQGFRLPCPGYVTSKFGMRRYRFHYGVDLKVQVGDSIRCPWDGMVRIVGYDPRGYGHFIVIRHDNGLETVYGHLSQPLYDENERILAGEVLGLGGNTGRSTGSHLHWELRMLGNAFNPEKLVNFETGQLLCTDTTYLLTKKGTYSHHAEMKAMAQAQYHKVRSGDTLSGIAKKYHTKVSTLCKLNRIKETSILQIGQRIRVR